MITASQYVPQREPFCVWGAAFSPDECDKIRDICELQGFAQGRIGDGVVDEGVRNSKLTWLELTKESEWIFVRIDQLQGKINYDKFQMDLTVFDGFQYGKYEPSGHYNWHVDTINAPQDGLYRKLSLVLMLSDDTEYAGGELLISSDGNPEKATTLPMKKGDMAAFYSDLPHMVTPVESGIRISLVTWVKGPKPR